MIISYRKKFIFIHIYKTGGSSVTKYLIPYARIVEKISTYWPSRYLVSTINRLFNLQDSGNRWINGVHAHASAMDIRNCVGEMVFSEYFTFSFVRNPYDLQVSLYHYIKSSKGHRDYEIANRLSFKEFLKREIENNAPCQTDFLTDTDGNLIIDYIGKTENIEQSLKYITNRLDIPFRKVPHLNKSLRSRNPMTYYDDETKELCWSYFKRDFKILGYEK